MILAMKEVRYYQKKYNFLKHFFKNFYFHNYKRILNIFLETLPQNDIYHQGGIPFLEENYYEPTTSTNELNNFF